MILKRNDILQVGDVMHYLNGDSLTVTGLAGNSVQSMYDTHAYYDIYAYFERPEPKLLNLLDKIESLLLEARKLAEGMK
jgi:hypothetical protein